MLPSGCLAHQIQVSELYNVAGHVHKNPHECSLTGSR